MKFYFKLLLAAFLISSAVTLANAAPPAANPAGKTFTLRLSGEPETLDWNRAHTMVETYVLMNLMEGLLTFDAKLKPVPALAERFTQSSDQLTYTFYLKRDVKWSDGAPLKAQDFVYSWKRLLTPSTAASYAYFLYDVEGAQEFNQGKLTDFSKVGIRALDDRTFQVKLVHPVAHWLSIPTFWVTFPLREDVVQKHGAGWAYPGKMVTVGPYLLSSYDVDSKIVMKANPLYYGKRGNISEVVGLIVKDDTTAMTLYESGKLDFMNDLSTHDLRRLAGRKDLKAFPYLKTGYMGFVIEKFPLTHAKVRRAISMAIDRSKIGEILHGNQKKASSFVPPGIVGHFPKLGLPYDPIKAKAELRNSGVDLSKPLQIELTLPNWDKVLTLGQYIQSELKKNLGIEVILQPFEHKTFRAQLSVKAFPMFLLSWSADYPDPDNFVSLFISQSGNNMTGWKGTPANAKYDALIFEGRKTQDSKKREKLYSEAQKLLIEDEAVVMPLYYEPNMALVREKVKGLELNPMNYLLLRNVNVGS